ncbi:hypothetical protein LPC_0291 [Legionella pneumophila str. Corby]|nr:hypothetical protein LPC_0291 [Legionella pneumophila str. Corby]
MLIISFRLGNARDLFSYCPKEAGVLKIIAAVAILHI